MIARFPDAIVLDGKVTRTNIVAAASTALLHARWVEEKPIGAIMAAPSLAGKGTIEMLPGSAKADVLYESKVWPMQLQFQKPVRLYAEVAVSALRQYSHQYC